MVLTSVRAIGKKQWIVRIEQCLSQFFYFLQQVSTCLTCLRPRVVNKHCSLQHRWILVARAASKSCCVAWRRFGGISGCPGSYVSYVSGVSSLGSTMSEVILRQEVLVLHLGLVLILTKRLNFPTLYNTAHSCSSEHPEWAPLFEWVLYLVKKKECSVSAHIFFFANLAESKWFRSLTRKNICWFKLAENRLH